MIYPDHDHFRNVLLYTVEASSLDEKERQILVREYIGPVVSSWGTGVRNTKKDLDISSRWSVPTNSTDEALNSPVLGLDDLGPDLVRDDVLAELLLLGQAPAHTGQEDQQLGLHLD